MFIIAHTMTTYFLLLIFSKYKNFNTDNARTQCVCAVDIPQI